MKGSFVAALLLLFSAISSRDVQAQMQTSNTHLELPDGTPIGWDKLDSIKKVWGADHVRFTHNEEDDKNHIMRLYRLTDAELKALVDAMEKHDLEMKAMIGKPAPLFTAKDIHGRQWSMDQLKGKVVVLNFWFTSCPPCNAEMPHLNEVVKKYEGKDVVFLALTFNDTEAVNSFLGQHTFAYTIIPLSKDIDASYKINSWPANFVIDRNGAVRLATGYEPAIDKTLGDSIESALL